MAQWKARACRKAQAPVEGGARVFEQEVNTWYVGAGLEGVFDAGQRTLYWDVNVAFSENEAEQTNFGSYDIRNIALALGDPAACAAVAERLGAPDLVGRAQRVAQQAAQR